jgi:DNA-binding NtrC family response regulator
VSGSERRRTILLVDDQDSFLSLLAEAVTDAGHSVHLAENGRVALQRLVDEKIDVDVVVSDIAMPAMDGLDFYDRAVWRRPELVGRFVFITGDPTRPAAIDIGRRVNAPLLTKPFSVPELLDALGKVPLRK